MWRNPNLNPCLLGLAGSSRFRTSRRSSFSCHCHWRGLKRTVPSSIVSRTLLAPITPKSIHMNSHRQQNQRRAKVFLSSALALLWWILSSLCSLLSRGPSRAQTNLSSHDQTTTLRLHNNRHKRKNGIGSTPQCF